MPPPPHEALLQPDASHCVCETDGAGQCFWAAFTHPPTSRWNVVPVHLQWSFRLRDQKINLSISYTFEDTRLSTNRKQTYQWADDDQGLSKCFSHWRSNSQAIHPAFALFVPPTLLSFLVLLKSVDCEIFQEFSRHSRTSDPQKQN